MSQAINFLNTNDLVELFREFTDSHNMVISRDDTLYYRVKDPTLPPPKHLYFNKRKTPKPQFTSYTGFLVVNSCSSNREIQIFFCSNLIC